jgi:DNA polymerase III alpha subunit
MMYSLQNYTAYSRGFGTANIKDWAKAAKKLGYPALGVCDRTTLAGAPRLVKACREAGIKPLLGMDVYLHESDERDENNKPIARLLLFALNDDGYQRLVKLNNRSQDREGLFYFRPRVTMEALLGACKDVACVLPYNGGGKLSTAVFEGSKGKFSGIVSQLHSMFETRFFIGCNPLENPEEIEALLDRGTMPYDVVYSFNCTGPTTEAAEASRTLMSLMKEDKPICNNGGVYSLPTQALAESRLGEPALQKFDFGMKRLFDMVTDFFVVGDYKLPEPPVPDLLAYMEQRLADGWRQKLDPTVKPGTTLRQIAQDPDLDKKFSYLLEKAGDKYANKHTLKEYMDQLLNEEIPLIVSKKFLPYFYIIDDICAHIDRVGLDRGVGRGSGAGSIFNYLTNITQCDPLRHGLSFSRFLSSARTDLPDIDLDFSDIARREVHRYLASVYGRQRLLNIGTYNRMKVKSAVKALAAAAAYTITDNDGEEVPYDPYFLNQILDVHTTQTSRGQDELDEMLTNDRFMEFYAKHSRFFMTKVMPLLESITSNGMHAAGIVICLGDAMSELPVLYNSTLEGYVTQYEMDAVDDAGRPKLDLLVIEAVDVVTAAKQMLKDYEGITIPGVEEINLQDKQALLTFRNVQTHPIFQFGTWSQRRFLRPLAVDSFEELVAAVALVRPGPMQAGTDKLFIDIKHGREKRPDDHASISEVLSESHGLMIYQEQMMKLSQVMAGFTGEEAEKLRKACGKKKPEEMAKWEAHFKTGSRKRGYTEDVTNKMWSQIVEFASYSFNKCLIGNTIVYRGGRNRFCDTVEMTIEELYQETLKQGPNGRSRTHWGEKILAGRQKIRMMSADGRIRLGHIKAITQNGVQPVIKVTLQNGMSITGTYNHRLLASTGYVCIDDLEVGDELLVMGVKEKATSQYIERALPSGYHKGRAWQGEMTEAGYDRTGAANPAFLDGRTKALKEAREACIERAQGKCESCNLIERDDARFEVAHMDTFEECGGDFLKFHAIGNVRYLCNSCHKSLDYQKGERKKAWSQGLPTVTSKIVSIEPAGEEMTYDIEMVEEEHNFIANGIVSHNSHSVAYTLTSFYQAWIKSRYPLYFWAAKMRFAKDDLKHPNNVYELKRYAEEEGIEFLFPTVHGFSQDFKPAGAGNQVFWKISAIKGVGDKAAALITNNGTINSFPDMDSFMSTLIRKKEVIDGVTVQESTGQVMNSRVMTALIGAGFFAPEYTPIEAMKRYREYMRVLNKKKVADELPPEFLKTFVDGKGNFDHTASQFYWAKLRNETLNCQVGRWKEIAGFDHENIQTFTEAQFNKIDDGKLVFIGGEVKQVSYYKYKSGRNAGKNWAQLVIEDGSERYVVKCWNEFWDNPALDRTRRRPSQGDLIELRGIKESFNGRSYIALNKPTDYCRIVAR